MSSIIVNLFSSNPARFRIHELLHFEHAVATLRSGSSWARRPPASPRRDPHQALGKRREFRNVPIRFRILSGKWIEDKEARS
jgi:hypothetical protein